MQTLHEMIVSRKWIHIVAEMTQMPFLSLIWLTIFCVVRAIGAGRKQQLMFTNHECYSNICIFTAIQVYY